MSRIIQKAVVFVLTFFSYAGLHALREGWSFSKTQLQSQFGVDITYLGLIDTLYLLCYSLGMGVLGSFINKIPLKWYVIGGMLLSSLFYCSFAIIYGLTGQFGLPLLTVAMCLNGFFQATGWPGIMGIFGNWFQKDKKGLLMAVWAMNANTGNIIANFICNLLQQNGASWTLNFISTALFAVSVAVLMTIFLRQKPERQYISEDQKLLSSQTQNQNPGQNNENSILTDSDQQAKRKPVKAISLWKALFLPRVPAYVVGYACLKGCIYGLLFWLPTYLDKKNLGDQKGYISSMIDIGSLVGGTIVGFLADKFDRRALFLSPLLFLCSIVMFIVSFALAEDAWQYYFSMLLVGILIGGPYNIIGTVIAIDLGQQTGSSTSITSVSSLIEGTAAVFAAVSQLIIPYIQFDFIFYLFAGQCITSAFVLFPAFYSEFKLVKKQRKQNTLVTNQQVI